MLADTQYALLICFVSMGVVAGVVGELDFGVHRRVADVKLG